MIYTEISIKNSKIFSPPSILHSR